MKKINGYRWAFYFSGLIILALGLTLNTKTGLGVAPLISIAFFVSEMTGLAFADMALVEYSLLVVVEIILHLCHHKPKRVLVMDVLQIPLSIVFTRFMGIFSRQIPNYTELPGKFFPSMAGRLTVLVLAIVLTGIGAAMNLNMRLIPNPGDGILQVISDITGKNVGLVKNILDCSVVTLTLLLCLCVSHRLLGVGLGTVVAMLGIGRVMALFNHLTKNKMNALAELNI